jgi:hypothetical protein
MPRLAIRPTAILALVLTVCLLGAASAVPPPGDPGANVKPVLHTRYLPIGTCDAIVLMSNFPNNAATVHIRTTHGGFSVVLPPKATSIIPFTRGWDIHYNDQARIDSVDTPFGDANDTTLCIAAWIVTDKGPMPLLTNAPQPPAPAPVPGAKK